MTKTVLFQTIQFSISTQFSSVWAIIGPYQLLPHWAKVDLGGMAMKSYSAFFKAPALPSDCLVSYPGHSLEWGLYSTAEKQSVSSTAPAN